MKTFVVIVLVGVGAVIGGLCGRIATLSSHGCLSRNGAKSKEWAEPWESKRLSEYPILFVQRNNDALDWELSFMGKTEASGRQDTLDVLGKLSNAAVDRPADVTLMLRLDGVVTIDELTTIIRDVRGRGFEWVWVNQVLYAKVYAEGGQPGRRAGRLEGVLPKSQSRKD